MNTNFSRGYFNKIPLFSKDLITFIIYLISLLVNIIIEPQNFLLTALNDAYKASPTSLNNKKKDHLNWIILDKWVFKSFILADEPSAKALRILETCVLVNNILWEKIALSLESLTT